MTSIIQLQSVCQSEATGLFFVQISIIMIYTFQLHSADVSKPVILCNRMSRVESENNVTNRLPCVCTYSQTSAFTNFEGHVIYVKSIPSNLVSVKFHFIFQG